MTTIYVTFKDKKEAETITATLLSERLIACANTWPITSTYRWEGKVETSEEVAAYLKTQPKHTDAVMARVAALHSYDVPCIVRMDATDSPPYASWVEDKT